MNKQTDLLKRFPQIGGEDYNLFKQAVPWHDDFQQEIGIFLSRYFADKPGKHTIVEAGTGTGLTTLVLLNANRDVKIISVDNEPKMLAVAKESLRDFANRVTFIENDIVSALSQMPDQSIYGFASAYTIHNLTADYREKLFQQLKRVLKPGGVFINADKYARENDQHQLDLKEQIADFELFDQIGRPDLKTRWTKHYLEDDSIKITEAEQIRILAELGFKDIKTLFRQRMEAVIAAIKI